jgi:hypothetical protein
LLNSRVIRALNRLFAFVSVGPKSASRISGNSLRPQRLCEG